MAVHVIYAHALHELAVARGHLCAVHPCDDAAAAYLLYAGDPVALYFLAVGLLQALADGMGGGALRKRRELNKLFLRYSVVVYPAHLEHAPGERAGLVEYHYAGLGQGLKVVGTLYQHPLLAGTAQSGEEAQRNAYHQRAGAADYQEGQCPVYPYFPAARHAHHEVYNGGQYGEGQCAVAYGRGIRPGEPGYEVLGAGFM